MRVYMFTSVCKRIWFDQCEFFSILTTNLYHPGDMVSYCPRVIRGLDVIGKPNAILLPHLVHDLHDDQALCQWLVLALLAPISQRKRALIRLPEHAVAFALLVQNPAGLVAEPVVPATPAPGAGLWPFLLLDRVIAVGEDDLRLRRAERRVHDLDFALGALDAHGRASRALSIGIGGRADARGGDAVGVAVLFSREGQQHRDLLVRAEAVFA